MTETATGVAYSLADITTTINGPFGSFTIEGLADEGITWEFDEDKNTMTKGGQGDGMHSLHAWNGGQCMVRLLKTSIYNSMLQAMIDGQRTSSAYWGQNILRTYDPVRGDSYVGTQSAFKKFAGNSYAKDGNILEWGFDVIKITPRLGQGAALYAAGIST